MIGRLQFSVTADLTKYQVGRIVHVAITGGQLPPDARAACWEWHPIQGMTTICVESEQAGHLCPWSPGVTPPHIALQQLPVSWWTAKDDAAFLAMMKTLADGAPQGEVAPTEPTAG